MGEQFRHLNMAAADFILEKTDGAYISLYGNQIVLYYTLHEPLRMSNGIPFTHTLKYSHYFDETLSIYEYELTLHDVYYFIYPAFLEPETQNLPHEWVWSLYYEETL